MSTLAKTVKDFVCSKISAVLCSNSLSQAGYPFGSVTPYIIDSQSRPAIYISLIAEHFKNLKADGHASLCIQDPFGTYDPQAYARATLLGKFETVPESDFGDTDQIYRQRFPDSESFQISHNFVYMRMQIEKIRWIGGFGQIAWVEAEPFIKATPDPLCADAFRIIEHMNNDHHDAILAILQASDTQYRSVKNAYMCGLDSCSMEIRFSYQGKEQTLKIKFENPAVTGEEARKEIIALLKNAKLCLG